MDERLQYTDHLSAIIQRAEREGHFDNLPGKGKPLDLGRDYTNPYEARLYKTMKDNNILPRWVELEREIDALKEQLDNVGEKEKYLNKLIKKLRNIRLLVHHFCRSRG